MAARLEQEFTAERFRSYLQEPFVIGLVLGSPLPKASEGAAKAFLRDVAVFMKNVEGAFARYARDARVETPTATHPVVVLIFEAREDFVKYAAAATSGDEDVAKRVAGFYSKLTNILAIRLEECRTFDTPLHEAIHQQVYVRKILQRLAPIPTWFDEGLATGFEANGGKINVGPGKISVRYANQALESQQVDWAQLLAGDEAFRAAATVDGAYGQAWGLHWLLVTRYKAEYSAYMRLLGQKKPLQEYPPEQRQADFQQAFGDKLAEMQSQFPPLLEAACRKQNVVLKPPERKGISLTEENLGQVQLTAVRHQTVGAAGLHGRSLGSPGHAAESVAAADDGFSRHRRDGCGDLCRLVHSQAGPAQEHAAAGPERRQADAGFRRRRGGDRPSSRHLPRPHPFGPCGQRRSQTLEFRPTAGAGVGGLGLRKRVAHQGRRSQAVASMGRLPCRAIQNPACKGANRACSSRFSVSSAAGMARLAR